MRIRQTLIWAMFLVLTLAAATAISAQSEPSSAPTTRTTASVESDLRDCSQMLDQSIEEVRALKAKAAALEQLVAIQKEIIARKDEQIAEQAKLIAIYERRKGTTISFLFGLIKIRKN